MSCTCLSTNRILVSHQVPRTLVRQPIFHTLVWGWLLWLPHKTIKLLPRSVHSRLTISISKALDQSNFKVHVGENFPKERTGDTKSSLYSDKKRQVGGRQSCAPKSYYWVYYKQGTVCGVACTQLRSNLLSTRQQQGCYSPS